jgi:hypothetical protein
MNERSAELVHPPFALLVSAYQEGWQHGAEV